MNLPTVDQLHAATVIIENGKAQAAGGFLMIASALSLVLKERLWVDSHANFGEYATTVGLSRSYCYKLAQIWDAYGERARGIDVHRLTKLLPLKGKVENEAEILEQARELNAGAWSDRLRELEGLKATDACSHEETGTYCKHCSKRMT